jgi:exodeoxyribonuclease-5
VVLTEIHRQAEGNPIIHLATLARQGKDLPLGNYGGKAWVIRKSEIEDRMLLSADQILCGKNVTRRAFNGKMRDLLGHSDLIPEKGEKVVCLRNDWQTAVGDVFLINGLVGYVVNDVENVSEDGKWFEMDFRPDFLEGEWFEGLRVDSRLFTGEQADDEDFQPREKRRGKVHQFDFGWCLTCHKLQGSEVNKLFVYHEWLGRDMNAKWSYTAVTRAKKKLIIAI